MYNAGKGKMVAVAELVKIRNKERNAMLSALKRKKGKGKSGPNILDEFRQEGENQGDLKKGTVDLICKGFSKILNIYMIAPN